MNASGRLARWLAVLLMGCAACVLPAQTTHGWPRTAVSTQSVVLDNWLICGPFIAARGDKALSRDFLAEQGVAEARVDYNSFAALEKNFSANALEAIRMERISGVNSLDFMKLFALDIRPGDRQGAAYAACILSSDAPRDAYLLAGSDDSLKVWLNGNLLLTDDAARPLHLYDDFVRLPLQRGDNFLLLKVGNVIGSWELAGCLAPTAEKAWARVFREDAFVFANPVIRVPAPLVLRLRGMPETMALTAVVRRYDDGKEVQEIRVGREAVDQPPGLYRVDLCDGAEPLGEARCLVKPDELLGRDEQSAAPFMRDDRTALNLDTLFLRWRHLLEPEHRQPADYQWQEKLIYTVTELEEALQRLGKGEEAFRGVPGLHLRAFRSRIDNQPQHYRVYIPPSYRAAGPPLPLIVMMATAVSASRPFLESAFIANQKEAEALGKIAAGLGAAIIWPGYRCQPYGHPCEFTHLDEVLSAVEQDYRIDLSRISLVGVCGGGMTAAMEAVQCPTRFAALGFVNPVLNRLKNRFDDTGAYAGQEAYQSWLRQTDPLERLAAIPDLPIWIIHDGVDPDHGPLAESVDFIEEARANGLNPRFTHPKELFSSRLPMWRGLLTWLVRQKRPPGNLAISGFPASADEGPVSRAFAEPFVVVRPTGGNALEQQACKRLVDAFRQTWQKTQYGDCRIVPDVELTPEEEKTENLILLGNERVNRVWARLANRLPFKLGAAGITVRDRQINGPNLSMEAIFWNPDFARRKVVLIGGADLLHMTFGTLDLSVDGWFDYAIWQTAEDKTTLLKSAIANYGRN